MDSGCHILLIRAGRRDLLSGRFILWDNGCRHAKDKDEQLGMRQESLRLVRACGAVRVAERGVYLLCKVWGKNEVRHQQDLELL